jgi:hypothetical protein
MKRFPFLLLDAGPIIKLFSLDIWDEFIKSCDVSISRIIAEDQALYTEDGTKQINLKPYEDQDLLRIIDVELSIAKAFYDKFNLQYKDDIHDGEKETLAFLCDSFENWLVCSADRAVFRVLGLLGKAEQGISLEEILKAIGLGSNLNWENLTPTDKDWKYTKKFREKWTHKGQEDFIHDWSSK